MARISGKAGSVDFGGGTIAGMKSWQIDYKFAALESTGFDSSGAKTFVAGLSEWAGSASGFKDGAPTAIGSAVSCVFKESGTSGQQWSGSAIITAIKPKTDVAGIVTYDYDFQGTGALTVATA